MNHAAPPLNSQPHLWLYAEECILPEREEVHVWRADLNQGASIVRALYEVLQADERLRADRFHFQQHRERFVVARGALRQILGSYLGSAPEQIRFAYNQYGKPALAADAVGDDLLSFNVSHSEGIALYAIARGRRVGLDIEHLREDFDALTLAERFFSPSEVATLSELPAEQQTVAFFNCWTRKEAYIKALGEGLSHPLDRFSVSLAPGERAALLSTNDNPQEASRWSLVELSPGDGYVAALAVEGHTPPNVHYLQWLEKLSQNDENARATPALREAINSQR
ncbi:MAG TPA: 4'-phosphopantetheinyl transferase superfamily protein [Pyrinomonadaceae bacterium]|nr:4'-phosphopantetheinyl transferase superfamily protein [Pyrinomonadaceae bacterium]